MNTSSPSCETTAAMHIIITGATGTIGMAILDVLLNDRQVTKVSILTRSPVVQAWGHDKADVIHVKDFGTWSPELLNRLGDAQGCIWALGDTRRDGVDTT
jgi:nucleoside-diphosphate-sugar epimerase